MQNNKRQRNAVESSNIFSINCKTISHYLRNKYFHISRQLEDHVRRKLNCEYIQTLWTLVNHNMTVLYEHGETNSHFNIDPYRLHSILLNDFCSALNKECQKWWYNHIPLLNSIHLIYIIFVNNFLAHKLSEKIKLF